jgi:hypothetical protein
MAMTSSEVASTLYSEDTFDPTWGATFTWSPYGPSSTRNHCVFCWATFVEPGQTGADACCEGYVTSAPRSAADDEHLWVCDSCFHENKQEFSWQVAPSSVQ